MENWKKKNRPVCLERRFEFACYEETRDFLDKLGELSEKINQFPDISFGKTYVNITIRPNDNDENTEKGELDIDFAEKINLLCD